MAHVRHMDETRWLIFGVPGTSHRFWLWVAQGEDVCLAPPCDWQARYGYRSVLLEPSF